MQVSTEFSQDWPNTAARLVGRQRDISPVSEQPGASDADEISGSPISFRKELTPEEERRVLFLENLLAQTLAMADGNPTDEQRTRIRDIEKELEKITGVKTKSSLTAMTRKMPGKKDGDEENEREKAYRLGIDPKEAAHRNNDVPAAGDNPGMQMLMKNAFLTTVGASGLSDSTSAKS